MPRIDSKRLPLRLKRWLTLLRNNGFKFSGLSRLFILLKTKGSSWLAEFKGIWFQSSDHLVDATLPATEVKSSELSVRNVIGETKTSVASGNEHIGEKQLTDVLVNW
ncbi:uncharacterized protein LOC110755852 isoform X1 [Prunus avium]|uniref:Uncharacterized protein LOC110755852 isoform X1 n=1 Tax=Prunus avium TaxID=42229 RepID=A0A6P5S755_PRUAV|nr:uncharacterized protein LOC110755852 isoform X1 [Prunus avium]